MISKIRDKVMSLNGRSIMFRYNGSRNQIEEFEGEIVSCYNCIFLIKVGNMYRSFSYSDVLIGVLEINI